MNIANFVTFGDSWPAGAELNVNEYPFGKIIANNLNLNFINFAEGGSSIEHLTLQLNNFLNLNNSENTIALFFLTEHSRSLYYKNGWKHTFARSDDDITNKWLKYFYSEELHILRANQTLVYLQAVCNQYKIKDFYVNGWSKFPITIKGIDETKIYKKSTCLEMFSTSVYDLIDGPEIFLYNPDNKFIKPKICHPNQLGHNKIAEVLTPWIKETII